MTIKHLTDEAIQQFVLDRTNAAPAITVHIESCEECHAKAETYRLVFAGISQQPEPVFDFNLAESILPQLSPLKQKAKRDYTLACLLVFSGIFFTGTMAYIFREGLPDLFANLAPVFIFLITICIITILTVFITTTYKDYQNKIKALDLY
jgi:hypothetical protein